MHKHGDRRERLETDALIRVVCAKFVQAQEEAGDADGDHPTFQDGYQHEKTIRVQDGGGGPASSR